MSLNNPLYANTQVSTVRVVATSNQTGTYLNGPSNNGVGATFTYATGALTIDSVALVLNDYVLLAGQTSAYQNGIYQVTTVGATGVAAVLTRRPDYQNIEQIKTGWYVPVSAGTVNAGSFWQLVEPAPAGIGAPVVANANDLIFANSSASSSEGGTAGNIVIFSGSTPALTENVASLNNVANSSATPGTVRSIYGEITSTATTMTSGNLVGVRGAVNMVGASGGFIYGTQGKVIATGTLSGSEWTVGLFGQLDISAATVNAGQMAPIWGDYGATSGTLTDQTGLYGIAMTNTTAAVLQGQLYLYGGAQNLMLLNTNSGLSGVTYFKNSGTGSGSWGNGTPPTPSKVLKILVDGTAYYLPLVAQNS